jgi:hypothetical protein
MYHTSRTKRRDGRALERLDLGRVAAVMGFANPYQSETYVVCVVKQLFAGSSLLQWHSLFSPLRSALVSRCKIPLCFLFAVATLFFSGAEGFGLGGFITEVDPISGAPSGASFFAPNGFDVGGLAFSPAGTLYVGEADGFNGGGFITEVDPISGAPIGASFTTPNGLDVGGLAFSPSGTLYVGEVDAFSGGGVGFITEVDPVTGASIRDIFGFNTSVGGMAFSPTGTLYVGEDMGFGSGGLIQEVDPDFGFPFGAIFEAPNFRDVGGLAFNSAGSLYVGEADSLGTGGIITEVDPISGAPVGASFFPPLGLDVGGSAFSPAGTLYVGEASSVGPKPTLVGDYNEDGKVNTPDYAVWKDLFGSPDAFLPNNIDEGGIVDLEEYQLWKVNFGSDGGYFPAPSVGGPELLIDLVRDGENRPVLDSEGRWQFNVTILPDESLFKDRDGDLPDKGVGGSTAIDLGLQVNDEHGFDNTTVSNLSANVSGQAFENDPNWDGNAVDALAVDIPGISPYGCLVDCEGLDAVGHQIDAALGSIYFNSDNGGLGHKLFSFSAGRPAIDSDFGGLTIEIDVDGGYSGSYRVVQQKTIGEQTTFDRPEADDFFTFTVQIGDVNLDGVVDPNDLSILNSSMGTPGKWTDGDLTGEGWIDATDRDILLSILVPEPATVYSHAVAFLWILPLLLRSHRPASIRSAPYCKKLDEPTQISVSPNFRRSRKPQQLRHHIEDSAVLAVKARL